MSRQPLTDAQKWILGGVAAVAALVAVSVGVVASSQDESSSTTASTTTTTSSTIETTTSTTEAADIDAYDVAYPTPGGSTSFDDPEQAARSFAAEVLGYSDLELGTVGRTGDHGAEVTVRARRDGAPSTIFLQRVARSWFVLGSRTEDIEVDAPVRGASLSSPFVTSGSALAFEGVVDVLVLSQSDLTQLGAGSVLGSGSPPRGPFEGRISYTVPPRAVPGILVYRILSAEDGSVVQATSFPVRLTELTAETPSDECVDTDDGGNPTPAQRIVQVFLQCRDGDEPVALRRLVPIDDQGVLRLAITALLAGPDAAEVADGFTSVFPVAGGTLRSVSLQDGRAVIDLSAEYAEIAPGGRNSGRLSSSIARTAMQFSSVITVEVHFAGSCQDYAAWAEADSCTVG